MSKVLPIAPVVESAPLDLPAPSIADAAPPAPAAWNGELESLDSALWFGHVPEDHRATVREGLTKVRNGMTADYTTKTQALATERTRNEQLLREISDRKEALQALLMGDDDPAAVLEAENAKSKAELVALRAEIEALKAQPAGSVTPEEVQALRDQLNDAVSWRQEVEQAAVVAAQTSLLTEIKSEAADQAEDDEFMAHVIDILASGRLDSFEDAVPRAVRATRALLERPAPASAKAEPDPLPVAIAMQSVTSGGKGFSGSPGSKRTYAELMKQEEAEAYARG